MTFSNDRINTHNIREGSCVGIFLIICGAIVFVIGFAISAIIFNGGGKPGVSWIPFAIVAAIGILVLLSGVLVHAMRAVIVRLTPNSFELPLKNLSIQWQDIQHIESASKEINKKCNAAAPLLLIYLTAEGRKKLPLDLVMDLPEDKRRFVKSLNPQPNLVLQIDTVNFGPGIVDLRDFSGDLMRRKASAAGENIEILALPDLDGPLQTRNMEETGPTLRKYICGACNTVTSVSGSSFYWCCNPLRYGGKGSICAGCGVTPDECLRWEDTGETLSRFRKRMWRNTPSWVKWMQFLGMPAIGAVIAGVIVVEFFPLNQAADPTFAALMFAGVGFIVTNALIYMTPLAGILPGLAGLKYNTYS